MTHPSNLPNAIDRAIGQDDQQGVIFYDGHLVQGGELNEAQTIGRARSRRASDLVAGDGDRIAGGDAFVDVGAETVTLAAGKVYVKGDVQPVAAAVLSGVAMTGRVEIGVWLVTDYVTHEDDPDLLGQVPGSLAEGEPGAAREVVSLQWGLPSDDLSGQGTLAEFFSVYVLQDGVLLDQSPPPTLTGVMNAIATYDFDAHANYIVSGHRVTALGKTGADQVFSIEHGTANVRGRKFVRHAALRHAETENWDTALVDGETHSYVAGPSNTVTVNRTPIATIELIQLTKEETVPVTRGGLANGADALPNDSVVSIIEVTQGGTTYVEGVDYVRSGDTVDWAPGGDEPSGGSSYNVTYRYRDTVAPDSFNDTEVTVSGGADGGDIIIRYNYKLPRIDLMCLAPSGEARYVKGVSSLAKPLPPAAPDHLLKLAEIHNDWFGKPTVVNNGTYNRTFDQIEKMADALDGLIRLVMLERSKSAIDQRDNVTTQNMFVDPLIDDSLRDANVAQTATAGDGMLVLPITPSFFDCGITSPVLLDYEEEVIVRQELATGCEKINPYQNFTPLPAAMSITPAADFWVESQTEWTSPVTREFNRGVSSGSNPLTETTTAITTLENRTEQAEFLREIDIDIALEGFGAGENLAALTFDDIDVKPGGVQTADGNGELTVTVTIPEGVPAGSKLVEATGEGGSSAMAIFTGQGIIETTVMQRITTVNRWSAAVAPQGGGDGDERDASNWGGHDPQAQIFAPPATRQLLGVDFKLCALGDLSNNILVHQVTVDNGFPTTDARAEAFVPMAGVAAGWQEARYNFPVVSRADRQHAFVIKTDDADHSVAIADIGAFDADSQQWVTKHPYPVGPRLSSVNASTWTAHQKSALAFRLVAAKFTSTSKTVDLGSHDLVNCSDLQIRASVDLPSSACSVVFEIERPGGAIYTLLPNQVLQLAEYITETVDVRAILTGTETLSPVLYGPVVLIAGEIATSAQYVSRAFDFGTLVRLTSYMKAFLPGGSTLDVEYDATDDNWQTLPLADTTALAFPSWTERKYEDTDITAVQGRLRLTLAGGPAARPVVGDLGAAIY